MATDSIKFREIGLPDVVDAELPKTQVLSRKDIAIIGMAITLPAIGELDGFWHTLKSGVSQVTGLSGTRRRDIERYMSFKGVDTGSLKYLKGSYLTEIDKFDNRLFRLTPKEASLMSPVQRTFLETAWKAIEDAGYGGQRLVSSNTGVYVGLISDLEGYKYKQIVSEVEPPAVREVAMAGNLSAIVPSRVSYLLDLKGPSILVDSACSSSLVAVYLACQALRNGDCDQALVGAARINVLPVDDGFRLGIESSDGLTRAFDDNSDGTGIGEGAAAVLLKPLSCALRDKDNIYAVIKGCAVNHDGRTAGITAPNPVAQGSVIVKAWEDAMINPESISYIEAHGTGTKLGDPIEVDGITKAFQKFTTRKQFCAIGSVKTNIGHLYEAAGIFGLIKVALALRHKEIPPSIHFENPNRMIDFTESPVYVNNRLLNWENDVGPRRAGVSSFGFSGTNCHMVLEEYQEEAERQVALIPFQVLTLSALEEEGLMTLIERYRSYLARESTVDLASICYTANTGRSHCTYRLAVIAQDINDLRKKMEEIDLTMFRKGQIMGNVFYGAFKLIGPTKPKEDGEITEVEKQQLTAMAKAKIAQVLKAGNQSLKELAEVCDLYVKGADIQWEDLYTRQRPRRVNLPSYPFQRKRCWVNIPESKLSAEDKQLLYTVKWVPEALNIKKKVFSRHGTVLMLKDGKGIGDKLAARFREEGLQVVEVEIGQDFRRIDTHCYTISSTGSDYARLIAELKGYDLTQIVHLASITPKKDIVGTVELEERFRRGVYSLFHLAEALAKNGVDRELDLVLVSEGVSQVTDREEVLLPENAPLFGFGKSLRLENPRLKVRAVEIDDLTSADVLLNELHVLSPVYHVAYRNGIRYVENLRPFIIKESNKNQLPLKENGVYVITGGIGGVGLEIARWMASLKKVHLALISRSPLPERQEWDHLLMMYADPKLCKKLSILKAIEKMGSTVDYFSADIAEAETLEDVLNDLRNRYGGIHGIIHCAGNSAFNSKTEDALKEVLNPKVIGIWLLDRLTCGDSLDFMVLCSSAVSLWGAPGQGDYVAANSYLDSYAAYRNQIGKRTICLNWAVWKDTGMAVDYGFNVDTELFKALTTSEALAALDCVLRSSEGRFLVGELNYKLQGDYTDLNKEAWSQGFTMGLADKVAEELIEYDNHNLASTLEEGLPEIEKMGQLMLLRAFQGMGVFLTTGEVHSIEQIQKRLAVVSNYVNLFSALLRILFKGGFLKIDDGRVETTQLVDDPEITKDLWNIHVMEKTLSEKYPDKEPYIKLMSVCINNYHEILTGKVQATHVMFPEYSMELVEKVYKGNRLADYFNQAAARCIRKYIETQKDTSETRIIEVGAGTGGTTESVLEEIQKYSDRVAYYYTDLSRGFTDYGRDVLGAKYHFVHFGELDIERDVEEQGLEQSMFDIVLASNVLHATGNIRNTLQQVRKLLKQHGILVLNEITRIQDFTTLTFGLLDGWWLHEDNELRLEHSPLLSVALWEKVLRESGFGRIRVIGGNGVQGPSQSLIIAEKTVTAGAVLNEGRQPSALRKEREQKSVSLKGRKDGKYSAHEKLVARVWSEVLGLDEVNIYDSFYEIGGDSILATKILNRINKEVEQGLTITEAMQLLTVVELANRLDQKTQNYESLEPTSRAYRAIRPVYEQEYYDASSAERRLYFLERFGATGTSYNIPVVMRGWGELSLEKVETIFRQLIMRHETLKTSFDLVDGNVVQRVHSNVNFHVDYQEIADLSEVPKIIDQFIRPFDLSKSPLLRVKFLKVNKDGFILMIDLHHLISDGISMGIIVQEFLALYEDKSLAALTISYKDFSSWQNDLYKSGYLNAQEKYWLDLFSGELPLLNMPTDYPRPPFQNYEGDRITFELGKELAGEVLRLAVENDTTLYMVLLACYNILLSKYTNQDEIIVGSLVAGRSHPDVENMVGMFVNMIAMRNFPSGEKTFWDFLGEVKRNSVKAYENQEYPFERLIEKLGLHRDMSRPPLFNTVFNMKITDTRVLEAPGLRMIPIEFTHRVSKFDFLLEVAEEDGIRCYLEYCTKLFRRETMERLAEDFRYVLTVVIENPNILIKDIGLIKRHRRLEKVLTHDLQFNI